MILIILFISSFLLWLSESMVSPVRILCSQVNQNVLGSSLVQSLSLYSRLAAFLQIYAIADIIDQNLFLKHRYSIVACVYVTIILSVLTSMRLGFRLYRVFIALLVRSRVLSQQAYILVSAVKPTSFQISKPTFLASVAYIFLYTGTISPLIFQQISPGVNARAIALSTVITGISTVLLGSYYEVKLAEDLQIRGFSNVPNMLSTARLLAATFCCMLSLVIAVSAQTLHNS